ncbi:MAG TPA: ABC transporter ATP-binding protein [Vicinamibacterales bacterium]|nr:ABC transporter ATP-binding protein [Vicinamibacterales bacterium]
MGPMVSVRDLRKRYRRVDAAAGVSFEIEGGEIFGLLGPNGAGKTTTVECTIGMREPDSGEIRICGVDARREPRAVKERIGAALQTTAVQDRITPREALALFGAFYRRPVPPQELLDRFALADKADVMYETLSGGQRQRLALALAFVNRPELVFLDEPTSGLDARARRELHDGIARMKEEGRTVLLTTHDIDEAEQLCDRVAIIDRGRIVQTGAPADLIGRSTAMPTVHVRAREPLSAGILDGLPGARDARSDGIRATFRTSEVSPAIAELASRFAARGIEIAELHVQKATLEDVFLELTGSPFEPGTLNPEP